MIRAFAQEDTDRVMEIWLAANRSAHGFIPESYWKGNIAAVRKLLQSALYVYEDERGILGFIGLEDSYIAGLFVAVGAQSQGIGRRLLDFVKQTHETLTLRVYQKNERAVRFYRREQFAAESRQIDEHTGEPEWRMVWRR